MNHQIPPREITPDEWLKPPVNYTRDVPPHVIEANHKAAIQMNAAKEHFIDKCFDFLLPKSTIGEIQLEHLGDIKKQTDALRATVDHTEMRLFIKPRYNPTILLPTGSNPNKNKAIVSQSGDVLEFEYKGQLVGSLEFSYNSGSIGIEISIRTKPLDA